MKNQTFGKVGFMLLALTIVVLLIGVLVHTNTSPQARIQPSPVPSPATYVIDQVGTNDASDGDNVNIEISGNGSPSGNNITVKFVEAPTPGG